ncbi:hypothetical protein F66182_5909 [Fusarium sp. NRRL 66182]|nr:hypothetical protein F66182_5909 [Fusarium sp. NRRL 66182]
MSCSDVSIEPVTNPDDFTDMFNIVAAAFGDQVQDGIWIAMNPAWNTPEGRKAGARRLADRWSAMTRNSSGQPNTVFIKATVDGVIAGLSIWQQFSTVDGHGDAPAEDLGKDVDLEALYPGNEAEQRYLVQAMDSLHRRRWEVVREKATASPPALMVMDLCVVDPLFQRKGIARKLVQFGLDEAQRRGGLECFTEASSMGRLVYLKQGFKQEGGEVVYQVDDEFKGRSMPSNIILRTGGQ